MQYFSKKKLILPEGYFVNSSQIPLAKEVNKLLSNCGCETFPIKSLSKAIQQSNFFFTIQNEFKNKLYGFVRVTSDRGLNANLWNLSAVPGINQQLYYSMLINLTLEKINREMPGCSISVQAPESSFKSLEESGFILDPNGIRVMGYKL
ncbi:GNAT family acetyltransferase [Prochlorococcus marinus str. MU1404]|uniref:N-acetyltransferase n=1 Tax=Prochlorococcus marinus TaxID=1219 RepID=UPI001ADACC9A|nr:N-acetyltransferase [Prochlorococcus marinus]MBO8230873.1 N-acetyltransferase [Prochlorococcus marinus XMU1404]MBW3073906.1 GNAT family acetyltransferase [Prochlorococcus marinus str. MU1404]MCR8544795.1 N-acetyltransferase [Prochlorococcus marinus CUG1432]